VIICKKKNGNISDVGDYRPASLATIISKLREHDILSCISPFFTATDNQFGFESQHGTDKQGCSGAGTRGNGVPHHVLL